MRGFSIGRFQPFHHGHLELVSEITTDVDELVIGIGSAEQSHTTTNPFTAGERIEITTAALELVDIRAYVVPITDIPSNAKWVAHTLEFCPRFDVVYANNPLVTRLYREAGLTVRETPLFNREEYQGTEIRRRMLAGEDWASLVPEPAVTVIRDIDGVERLTTIAGTDTTPA